MVVVYCGSRRCYPTARIRLAMAVVLGATVFDELNSLLSPDAPDRIGHGVNGPESARGLNLREKQGSHDRAERFFVEDRMGSGRQKAELLEVQPSRGLVAERIE